MPSNFPLKKEERSVAYQCLNFSDGTAASEGRWVSGPTPDGKGEFTYHDGLTTSAPMPPATHPDARFYGTRTYLLGGGVVYAILWIYGLVIDQQSAANFVPVDSADNWLHFLLAVGMIALALILSRDTRVSTNRA